MKAQLAQCLNCYTILVDENPNTLDVHPEFEVPDHAEEMVFQHDETGQYWICPHCKTDECLIDITSIDQMQKTESKIAITDQEIDNYLNHTMTAGETHIREEIRWLINCASNDARKIIKEVSNNWKEK